MTHALRSQSPSPDLTELRRTLDAVDQTLLAAVTERFAAVDAIATAKAPSGVTIRPDREAAILAQRLAATSAPAAVVAAIWRTLITAACLHQRPFSVHVAAPLEAAAMLYPTAPMVDHPSAAGAIDALTGAPGDVALVAADGCPAPQPQAHPFLLATLTDGRTVLALGGRAVERSCGPITFVVRGGRLVADAPGPAETAVAHANPYPLKIPVAQTP